MLPHFIEGGKVLIHGATGGVDNFATQTAKYFDTYIVGTTSETGLQFARELGADEVIDYRNQRFEEISGNFDLILDTVGGENFIRSLNVAKTACSTLLLRTQATDLCQPRHRKSKRRAGKVSSSPRKKLADKQTIYNLILRIYNLKLRI